MRPSTIGLRDRIARRYARCAACHAVLGSGWRLWRASARTVPVCARCYAVLAD